MPNNVVTRFAVGSNNIAPLVVGTAALSASISTSSLPSGVVGTAYSGQITGVGTFTATGLPPGVTLSSAGTLGGLPTIDGSYSVTFTATQGNTTASKVLVISIAAQPVSTTTSNASGWAVLMARTRRG